MDLSLQHCAEYRLRFYTCYMSLRYVSLQLAPLSCAMKGSVPCFISLCVCVDDAMLSLLYISGWRSGEYARLPPMLPGFDSRTRRHIWVEFVVGSRPCSEGFSPVFFPAQKPTLPNSNSIGNTRPHKLITLILTVSK